MLYGFNVNQIQVYTISKISSARFAVSTYPVKPEIGVSSSINNAIRNDTATNITITSGANDNYLDMVI